MMIFPTHLESDLQSRENNVQEACINQLNEKFDGQLNLKDINIPTASAVPTSNVNIITVATEKNDTFISQ